MQEWIVHLEIKDQGQVYEQTIIVDATSEQKAKSEAIKVYMRTTPWAFTKPKVKFTQIYKPMKFKY
jgi:ribosomal silencing factor RsfS